MQRKGRCICRENALNDNWMSKLQRELHKFESTSKNLPKTPPQSPVETSSVADPVGCGESLLKLLVFEPANSSDETEKCIAFWGYIRSRKDIKPAKTNEFKTAETASKNDENNKVHDETSKKEEEAVKTQFPWTSVLQEIKRLNLHKLAMAPMRGVDCNLCKNYLPKAQKKNTDEELDEIVALNEWRSVKRFEAYTQTSQVKLVNTCTDNQNTASFQSLFDKNRPKEYIERETGAQNFQSLMNVKLRPLKELPEDFKECTCPTKKKEEKCPYHVANCTCGQMTDIECPYHKVRCTCGTKPDLECPYHKEKCTCGVHVKEDEIKKEPCPYHKQNCTCGAHLKEEMAPCPYHKEICDCGTHKHKKVEEQLCPYHKENCTCGADVQLKVEEQPCPYHKDICNCSANAKDKKVKEQPSPYHMQQKDKAIEEPCPYHVLNCICSNALENQTNQECPYHKLHCVCKDLVQNLEAKSSISDAEQKSSFTTKSSAESCICNDEHVEILLDIIKNLPPDCPYHESMCRCGENALYLTAEDGGEYVYNTYKFEDETNLEEVSCESSLKAHQPECPEIITYCNCGKRIQSCVCPKDDKEKPPVCPYHKFDCTCGVEVSTKCPYHIDNCRCGTKGMCTCLSLPLQCPNNSESCVCVEEKEPCPYGKVRCTCGKPDAGNVLKVESCGNPICQCSADLANETKLHETNGCACNG